MCRYCSNLGQSLLLVGTGATSDRIVETLSGRQPATALLYIACHGDFWNPYNTSGGKWLLADGKVEAKNILDFLPEVDLFLISDSCNPLIELRNGFSPVPGWAAAPEPGEAVFDSRSLGSRLIAGENPTWFPLTTAKTKL